MSSGGEQSTPAEGSMQGDRLPAEDAQRTVEQLNTVWHRCGIDPSTLRPATDGTLLPLTEPPVATDLPLKLPLLGVEGHDELPELRLVATLGQGGMGVVKLARQLPLDREVAVKLVRRRDDGSTGGTAADLVREGCIIGSLEHPNVVPVHALGCDAGGAPMLVMKRIQGESWSTLLRDASGSIWERYGGDRLELILDVMLQVCDAVHFAHSRGVIHRDLKPDNVMVGDFGEVYVVDWGVAVSLHPDPRGLIPCAAEVRDVVGTPNYMAPEQVLADGPSIDQRTDVYLLGATLHECLTGEPRHQGDSVTATLKLAYLSAPAEYPDAVPAELGEICNRACHPQPAKRYGSARELRDALQRFRHHRSSTALCAEARVRLAQMRELQQQQQEQPQQAYGELQRLFTECRFGFGHALSSWPENPDALAGQQEALELMARQEQSRGDAAAAAALLEEMVRPPADLVRAQQELERRCQQEQEEVERLRRMRQLMDPSVGSGIRAWFALAIGLMVAVVFGMVSVAQRLGGWTIDMAQLTLVMGTLSLTLLVLHLLGERYFKLGHMNLRLHNSFRAFIVGFTALPVAGLAMGLRPEQVVVLTMLLVAVGVGIVALAVDRRLLPPGVIYFGGFAAGAHVPALAFEVFAVAHVAAMVLAALAWRGLGRAGATAHDDSAGASPS